MYFDGCCNGFCSVSMITINFVWGGFVQAKGGFSSYLYELLVLNLVGV